MPNHRYKRKMKLKRISQLSTELNNNDDLNLVQASRMIPKGQHKIFRPSLYPRKRMLHNNSFNINSWTNEIFEIGRPSTSWKWTTMTPFTTKKHFLKSQNRKISRERFSSPSLGKLVNSTRIQRCTVDKLRCQIRQTEPHESCCGLYL